MTELAGNKGELVVGVVPGVEATSWSDRIVSDVLDSCVTVIGKYTLFTKFQ